MVAANPAAGLPGAVQAAGAMRLLQLLEVVARTLRDDRGRLADRPEAAAWESPEVALPSTSPSLTARELEVLALVAQGQTNREVARSLTVSPATVKRHVENILGKMGVVDRTEAAVRAIQFGLLTAADSEAGWGGTADCFGRYPWLTARDALSQPSTGCGEKALKAAASGGLGERPVGWLGGGHD